MTTIVTEPFQVGESPTLEYQFQNSEGTAVDLTAATDPAMTVLYPDGSTDSFDSDAGVIVADPATGGTVRFTDVPELTLEGPHRFWFWVTPAGEDPICSPTLRFYAETSTLPS